MNYIYIYLVKNYSVFGIDLPTHTLSNFHLLAYTVCKYTFHSDKYIKDLMEFFRSNWPAESITPKLHMLEDHVCQFIKQWGFGLGVYDEQGGESIC